MAAPVDSTKALDAFDDLLGRLAGSLDDSKAPFDHKIVRDYYRQLEVIRTALAQPAGDAVAWVTDDACLRFKKGFVDSDAWKPGTKLYTAPERSVLDLEHDAGDEPTQRAYVCGWNDRGLAATRAAGDARDAAGDALQRAAGELPYGWNVMVDVELGASSVTLVDPDGEESDFPIDRETSIADAVIAATNAALTQEQPNG